MCLQRPITEVESCDGAAEPMTLSMTPTPPMNRHPKRIDAARGRRDRGESPMPWDNRLLRKLKEPCNELTARIPEDPTEGSDQAIALNMLHIQDSVSIDEVMRRTKRDNESARGVLGSLRQKAWWIESVGSCRFVLVNGRRAA